LVPLFTLAKWPCQEVVKSLSRLRDNASLVKTKSRSLEAVR